MSVRREADDGLGFDGVSFARSGREGQSDAIRNLRDDPGDSARGGSFMGNFMRNVGGVFRGGGDGKVSARSVREQSRGRSEGEAAPVVDLNADARLDNDELVHLARTDGARFDRYIAADLNNDGVLDEHELKIAEEGEEQHRRLQVLRKLKSAFKHRLEKRDNYGQLFLFTMFMLLYLSILYVQSSAESAYGMASTITNIAVPTNEETDEVQAVYADKSDVFRWLRRTFAPVWADPQCGDGACSEQTEFPGFGRFGCTADCGAYTFLTTLEVEITPRFEMDDGADGADETRADFLARTAWNLCTLELFPGDGETCWYAQDVHVSNLDGVTEAWRLAVPGMRWYVRLVAPYGGTAGRAFFVDDAGVKTPAFSWDYCHLSGSIATRDPEGMVFDMYAGSSASEVAPAPPAPLAPLPMMPASVAASVSLFGYSAAQFGNAEKAAFREAMGAILGVRSDRIVVDSVTDVAGRRRRRSLLLVTEDEGSTTPALRAGEGGRRGRTTLAASEIVVAFTVLAETADDASALSATITNAFGTASAIERTVAAMSSAGLAVTAVESTGDAFNISAPAAVEDTSDAAPATDDPALPAMNAAYQFKLEMIFTDDILFGSEVRDALEAALLARLNDALIQGDATWSDGNSAAVVPLHASQIKIIGFDDSASLVIPFGDHFLTIQVSAYAFDDVYAIHDAMAYAIGGAEEYELDVSDLIDDFNAANVADASLELVRWQAYGALPKTGCYANDGDLFPMDTCTCDASCGACVDGTPADEMCITCADERFTSYQGVCSLCDPSAEVCVDLLTPGILTLDIYSTTVFDLESCDDILGAEDGPRAMEDAMDQWFEASTGISNYDAASPDAQAEWDAMWDYILEVADPCGLNARRRRLLDVSTGSRSADIDRRASRRRLSQSADEWTEPESPAFLGRSSVTCASGHKKLLLLRSTSTLMKGWPMFLRAFVTNGVGDPADGLFGQDWTTTARNNFFYEPEIYHPTVETTYAKTGMMTAKSENDLVDMFTGMPAEVLQLFEVVDATAYPEIVEMCVPENQRELTLWMHFADAGFGLTYDSSGTPEQYLSQYNYPDGFREETPSFAIMDEDGCLATPETLCEPYFNHDRGVDAINTFSACPTNGVRSSTVTMTLRDSSDPDAACDGLHAYNDASQLNYFPEIDFMDAIESGFGVPQYSESITDAPAGDAECPAGTKRVNVLVESPNAGFDAFSYGIRSVTESGKITSVRRSGGTLTSPRRFVDVQGERFSAKFPYRFKKTYRYSDIAFDCMPERVEYSDSNWGPGQFKADPSEYARDAITSLGMHQREMAHAKALESDTFSNLATSEYGRCIFTDDATTFVAYPKCASLGEYRLEVSRADYYSPVEGHKVSVTDANGCELATVDVPSRGGLGQVPVTSVATFTVDADTGVGFSLDAATGAASCEAAHAVSHATPPLTSLGAATPPAKPSCPTGFQLFEVSTQTSWGGEKNAWVVNHVTLNDTAIASSSAGYGSGATFNLSAAASVAANVANIAPTNMRLDFGAANELRVDQWCLRPGNYSMTLKDHYGASNDANVGWRGGTVTLTDADECEILRASPSGSGAESEVSYFRVTPRDADAGPRNCTAAGLVQRSYSRGFCTFDVPSSASLCNGLDVRSAITGVSTADQRRCKEGMCSNPKCHDEFMLSGTRTSSDLNLGCCKHVSGDAPFALDGFDVPVSSPDATDPVPVVSSVRKRFVGTKNVIVGGVLLHQSRSGVEPCTGKFGDVSGQTCPLNDKISTAPYGVDPVFISTSTLYDERAFDEMCCRPETDNATAAEDATGAAAPAAATADMTGPFYKESELNAKGIPFGFYSEKLDGRQDGFSVVIDVNLRESGFEKLMTYLEDGFFIDQYTKSLRVEMLTYNGELRFFCNLVIDFDFSQGGNIVIEYSADTAATQPYYYDASDASKEQIYHLRIFFEAMFCLFVFYSLSIELFEMGRCLYKYGNLKEYFSSVWNYIELVSIGLHIACIGMWAEQIVALREFDTEPRFDVYLRTQHDQMARSMELRDDGAYLRSFVVDVLKHFNDVIAVKMIYQTFHGINIFLCLLRFFKSCDFQPKLGIVTRTIGMAFQELAHFVSLLGVVAMVYTCLGHVVFGSKVEQFSSLTQAGQTVISWTLAGDDRDVGAQLFKLPGNLVAVGALYYVSFCFITSLMLLNFLIAILSDGYMKVQEESSSSVSFISELSMLCAKWLRSQTSRGKLITDRKALRRVRAMLAAEEHERELFRKRHGLGETFNAGSTDKKDEEDSDYSDAEDVVRADGMVSFEGVEDDDVNIEELRRILQGGNNAAQRATKAGLRKAQSGLGDVDVLLDTVIKSVGDRVEKKHISAMEKKVNETHSLVMLMYKHMTEQQEALERLKMDVKAGAPRAKGDFTALSTSGADIPRALGGHN